MNIPFKLFHRNSVKVFAHRCVSSQSSESKNETFVAEDDEFRVLKVRPSRAKPMKEKRRMSLSSHKPVSRASRLDPDSMDWKSIWPGPRSFAPHTVPLPVRQGILDVGKIPFNKYGNLELMKIPNFLHLTPPAIKAHCEELKKFCTPFPAELDTKKACEKHFPVTVITNDYLHSSPTIRDPLSRVVTMKIFLKDIPLDEHARDKLLRLVGERYNPQNDSITIVTDRCPTRKQNYDYAQYLLTALFFESWKTEPWEAEKTEPDMEKYVWENNASAKTLARITKWTPDRLRMSDQDGPLPDAELKPEHKEYAMAVTRVLEDEQEEAVEQYKNASMKILKMKI